MSFARRACRGLARGRCTRPDHDYGRCDRGGLEVSQRRTHSFGLLVHSLAGRHMNIAAFVRLCCELARRSEVGNEIEVQRRNAPFVSVSA